MLKPLTMGLGLAVALGLSSVSLAGGHHKAMPSAQEPAPAVASPQGVVPSSQDAGCGDVLAGPVKKGCGLLNLFKPKPKCYTYEWVLKKKRVRHGLFGGLCGGGNGGGCGEPACGACGGEATPSAQWASPQGDVAPAPQAPYGAPQGGYGAPQAYSPAAAPQYVPTSAAGQAGAPQFLNAAPAAAPAAVPAAPAPAGDPALEPPPPPRAADAEKTSAVNDGLLLLPAGN